MTTATLRFQDDGGVSEVELSKSTARQLEELIEDFETEIDEEVFRKALQTFKALRDLQKTGHRIVINSELVIDVLDHQSVL